MITKEMWEGRFADNELTAKYFEICSKHSDFEFVEEHHILPRKMYPEYENCTWNRVKLRLKDHYIAHKILMIICLKERDKSSMAYAWNLMANRIGSECYTEEDYETLKIEFIKNISGENHYRYGVPEPIEKRLKHSERMSGSGNPMYGLCGEKSPAYGFKHTEEEKAARSDRIKGTSNPMHGRDGFWKGKNITDAMKEAVSEKNSKFSYGRYNKEGVLLEVYQNIKAVRDSGFGRAVYLCINNMSKTSYGFVWKHKPMGENFDATIDPIKPNRTTRKFIYYQYNSEGKLMRSYNNVSDLQSIGFDLGNVLKACSGKTKTYKGFTWVKRKIGDVK